MTIASRHMPDFPQEKNRSWFTDQGIRAVKDAPKRAQAARDLAKKLGVEIKQVFLTSGDSDLLLIFGDFERRQYP